MTNRSFRTGALVAVLTAVHLGPALPRAQTNVCVRLAEPLLLPVPQELIKCTWSKLHCAMTGMVHCCNASTCAADPTCGAVKTIRSTYQVVSQGEFYCNFSASQIFDRFAASQIELTTEMLAGGLPSEFFGAMGANIDLLKASSVSPSSVVKQALRDLVAPLYRHGDYGYSYSDIDRVRIVSEKTGNASWYLRDAAGITLSDLVVLRDDLFRALVNPAGSWTLDDIQWGRASPDYIAALDILDHELVHVAQYRRYGTEPFLTSYVLDWLVKGGGNQGYERSSYEREAYQFGAELAQAAGGPFCETTAEDHVAAIRERHLDVDWKPCKPYLPSLSVVLTSVFGVLLQ